MTSNQNDSQYTNQNELHVILNLAYLAWLFLKY